MVDDEYNADHDAEDFDDDEYYEAVDEDATEEPEQPKEDVKNIELLSTNQESKESVQKSKRVTSKRMTRYETAKVLGARAQQIVNGAPVMIELDGEIDPLEIATKELKHWKIPMIIRRYFPDRSYEDWEIEDFKLKDSKSQ